jgi:prepilin-type N-terminal cleavage/methylation domain-containing protein
MKIHRKEKGFTIIEVVLVLAIAGLIFLMVFIALPALERSQRDTQRKNDLARLETALTNYTSNNRGSLPTDWNSFENQYLLTNGDSFIDPSGSTTGQTNLNAYNLIVTADSTTPMPGFSSTTQNVIWVTTGATCNTSDSTSVVGGAGARKVAFRMALEGGGVDCLNN